MSTCTPVPVVPWSLALVRGIDCLLKVFSVALIAMNLPIGRMRLKAIPMHTNLKILLANFTSIYVLHVLAITSVYVVRQIKLLTSSNGCITPWAQWQCLVLFAGRFGTTAGFTIAHAIILFERIIATYYAENYEKSKAHAACCLTVICWLVILGWTFYVFHQEDPSIPLADCVPSMTVTRKWTPSMYYCLALDIVVSIGDLILLIVNVRQRKRNLENYSLHKSYQLKENHLTTQVVFPCSFVHTCGFAGYLVVNSTAYTVLGGNRSPWAVTILDSTQFMMSAYIYATLLFFYWVRRRVARRSFATNMSQDVNEYFQHFERQIAFGAPDEEVTFKWMRFLTRFIHRRVYPHE